MSTSEQEAALDSSATSINPLSEPCVMVIFGASGDLTKRLLVPSLYNLACDGLLSPNFAVLGSGRSKLSDEAFRTSMANETSGLRAFHTRHEFDEAACDELLARFHFESANIDVEDFIRLKATVEALDENIKRVVMFCFTLLWRHDFLVPCVKTCTRRDFKVIVAGNALSWRNLLVQIWSLP